MSNHINKDDPKRWFYVQSDSSGESSLICFGFSGEQFISETITGQFLLEVYLTERELEIEVNLIAGSSNYYELAVENNSSKFQGPSTLYTPNIPPEPIQPIPPDIES